MSISSDRARCSRDGDIARLRASNWVNRFRQYGDIGLLVNSSAPHRQPTMADDNVYLTTPQNPKVVRQATSGDYLRHPYLGGRAAFRIAGELCEGAHDRNRGSGFGNKLPSVREPARARRISITNVIEAYRELEATAGYRPLHIRGALQTRSGDLAAGSGGNHESDIALHRRGLSHGRHLSSALRRHVRLDRTTRWRR
jgi:hypothetical protein